MLLLILSLVYMAQKTIKNEGRVISSGFYFFLQLVFNIGIILYETVLVVPFS